MKDLAIQKAFLQLLETTSPGAKNYYPLRKLFSDYLTKLNVAHFDICCAPSVLDSLPLRYNNDNSVIQYFDGESWNDVSSGGSIFGPNFSQDGQYTIENSSDIIAFFENQIFSFYREGSITVRNISGSHVGYVGTYIPPENGGYISYGGTTVMAPPALHSVVHWETTNPGETLTLGTTDMATQIMKVYLSDSATDNGSIIDPSNIINSATTITMPIGSFVTFLWNSAGSGTWHVIDFSPGVGII